MNQTRRNTTIGILAFLLGTAAVQAQQPVQARYGINFEPLKDWSREQPLINVMKLARPWISQARGQWDTKQPLELDEHGYVKKLAPGQWAGTVLLTEVGSSFPGGRYVFTYDGKGTFDWEGNGSRISSEPGRDVVEVTPGEKGFVHLIIKGIDPDDYPRNLRFYREEFDDVVDQQLFTPEFMDLWSDADTFRYMEWGLINHSPQKKWEDRSVPEDCSFWKKGAPLEYMIDLANQADANMWVCIPHLADDDYIRQYAEMVRDNLKDNLFAYFEYSNEVWNGLFAQNRWACEQGQAAGLDSTGWKAGLLYYAQRCNHMFSILDEVYEDAPDRYRKVVATQGGNIGVTRIILPKCGDNADALSIAPYVTFNVPKEKSRWKPNMPTEAELESWTVDQIFNYLHETALPAAKVWMDQHKDLADDYNLELTCYESGQHLSALGEVNRNKKIVDMMSEANRDPRMGEIYTEYLNHWNQIGGGVICLFNSMHAHSPSGYWGLLEYTGQDPATAPKYMAVKEWAKKLPSRK